MSEPSPNECPGGRVRPPLALGQGGAGRLVTARIGVRASGSTMTTPPGAINHHVIMCT